jgi:hypothetical protein
MGSAAQRARGPALRRVVLAAGIAAACMAFNPARSAEVAPSGEVRVSVNAGREIATVKPGAVGLDINFPNPYGASDEGKRLFREAGIQALAYDGGPAVDLYDWRTNTLRPWPNPDRAGVNYASGMGRLGTFEEVLQPKVTFDDFARSVRETGTIGRVHVNYGTGTPEEAAGWVAYSRERGYPIKYWEIGQNPFGNGFLGRGNEPDAHGDKSPQGYVKNAREFIAAMRRADPTIKIGIGLSRGTLETSPEHWAWNETVLAALAKEIDFVDVEVFPEFFSRNTAPRGLSDAEALQFPATRLKWTADLKALIAKHAGPNNDVEVIIGETISNARGTQQSISLTAALFLPDAYLSFFEGGVDSVYWYASHIGIISKRWYARTRVNWSDPNSPVQVDPDERLGYGDFALISSGTCDDETNLCQLPANTPFPPYYGMQILTLVAPVDAKLLASASSSPMTAVHASRRPDGSLAILLINKDPVKSQAVTVDLAGFKPRKRATVAFYGRGSQRVDLREDDVSVGTPRVLPPYSLTVLILKPA